MGTVAQDIRIAWRTLRRSPAFTAVAVLTLALGIGAATTIFTIVNGVLLRPLPYRQPDRLANLWVDFGVGAQSLPVMSPGDFQDYQQRSQSFEMLAAGSGAQVIGATGALTGVGAPERVDVSPVTANFFPLLGVTTPGLSDIEIRMQRRATYTVAGTVIDASGSPADTGYVNVICHDRHRQSKSVRFTDGRFVVNGLTPGRYAVQAGVGGRTNPDDRRPPARELEMGYVPIQIDAADVMGIVVTTSKGAKVAGRVAFEGAAPPRADGLRMTVHPRLDEEMSRMYLDRSPGAGVNDDLTFLLSGVFAPQGLAVQGLPAGWIVKTVRYNGHDITDVPTQFTNSTNPRALEIVLSNRGAALSARVVDAEGRSTTDCQVVLFSADPARWTLSDLSRPVLTENTFQLGSHAAGDYLVIAIAVEDYQLLLRDRGRLESLAKVAQPVRLRESEQRTIQLGLADRVRW